ncbi:F-type H+-transporting ATPase subunit delta [Ruminiclostridium sufflavum DSM 19573]|uniref:ATP synthase subunit delta n=1 Tax=Ruminiclostridium sufflavum DSM 19573 TaxID=1121337 RepID=A0A318XQC4_9FIRM|nr:F0F1 ATP synthase subunit delta [Ruminiclostridium sufflavum]PYG89530.1 F-type H+-transporting ATPase subunit delta [Ruminiclostridium sufflavum DSM 19573]
MPLVEKRYAQALMELSQNSIESVREEFEGFVAVYDSDMEFRDFLANPTIKDDKKQTVIRNVFTDKLSKNMLNFILLLIDKKRINNISEIYQQLVRLINEKFNVLDIKIITAEPLTEQQLLSIKEKFRNKYDAIAVKAEEVIDASIIGGVKVIIGDKVYDGSIKGRIESLTELVSI